jgi:hypothetical protein
MSLPPILQHLRIPVIGAPMFIAGNPMVENLAREYVAARQRLQIN